MTLPMLTFQALQGPRPNRIPVSHLRKVIGGHWRGLLNKLLLDPCEGMAREGIRLVQNLVTLICFSVSNIPPGYSFFRFRQPTWQTWK